MLFSFFQSTLAKLGTEYFQENNKQIDYQTKMTIKWPKLYSFRFARLFRVFKATCRCTINV